jgi:hypothetical protein
MTYPVVQSTCLGVKVVIAPDLVAWPTKDVDVVAPAWQAGQQHY